MCGFATLPSITKYSHPAQFPLAGAKLAVWKADESDWPNNEATGCRLVIGLVLTVMPPEAGAVRTLPLTESATKEAEACEED